MSKVKNKITLGTPCKFKKSISQPLNGETNICWNPCKFQFVFFGTLEVANSNFLRTV